MDKKTRGCLWAALGIAVVLVMVGAALVGGAGWIVYQGTSIEVDHPDPERAKARFDEARRRFSGQTPLVVVDADGSTRVVPRSRPAEAPTAAVPAPESFHVMVWNPSEKELAHVKLPFWLLKLGGAKGKFMVNGGDPLEDLHKLSLTVDDIEKAGPGLVLDRQDRRGEQVLIWTE